LAELRGEPIVAFQEGLAIRAEIDRALAKHQVAVKIALEFDNIETIKRAIEIGAGVSILPEPTLDREVSAGTLVKVRLVDPPLVRPLGIIHRRDRKLSETAARFVHLLEARADEPNQSATNGHVLRRTTMASAAVG
jgi:DNA-binding transcriptional LysR family regulator